MSSASPGCKLKATCPRLNGLACVHVFCVNQLRLHMGLPENRDAPNFIGWSSLSLLNWTGFWVYHSEGFLPVVSVVSLVRWMMWHSVPSWVLSWIVDLTACSLTELPCKGIHERPWETMTGERWQKFTIRRSEEPAERTDLRSLHVMHSVCISTSLSLTCWSRWLTSRPSRTEHRGRTFCCKCKVGPLHDAQDGHHLYHACYCCWSLMHRCRCRCRLLWDTRAPQVCEM